MSILLLSCTTRGYTQNILLVKGKDSLETKIIDSIGYINEHQNFLSLEKEVDNLLLKVQKVGFIEADIFQFEKENDSVHKAFLHLNKKHSNIKLYYPLQEEEKKALANVSIEISDSYFIIPIYYIEESLNQLISLRSRKGEVFSSLKLSNIKKEQPYLSAQILSTNSKIRKIDGIVVEGYDKFPAPYIKYYLRIRKGQIFDRKKLLNRTNRVKNLPFVSQIKPPEVLFTRDSTIAYLYLKKENSNLFDGFLGFSNSENNKLIFSGNLNLRLYNNLNYGEKLQLHYKSDGQEQINFNVDLELPFLFKTPISAVAGLNLFKQDSTFLNVDYRVNGKYIFSSTTSTHIGYRSSSSTNLLQNTSSNTNIEDFEASFINIGGIYEDLDLESILFPIKTRMALDLDIGTRTSLTKANQQILRFGALKNFFITEKSAFYISNTTNFLNSDKYLANELFRFGGINSIRGFLENSISANLFTSFQTEYRYILSPNLYAHTIVDFAFFENSLLTQSERLAGYGLGFGFNTKSGLLKLNLANGSFPGESFSFSNSKVHLSLTLHF